jgi:hypothetical protein
MKITLHILGVLAIYYGFTWIFNHSGYPFAAIIGAILFTAFLIQKLYKSIEK